MNSTKEAMKERISAAVTDFYQRSRQEQRPQYRRRRSGNSKNRKKPG